MKNIYVTKSFLPPIEKYFDKVKEIWLNEQLTNQGPMLQAFESRVKERLKVKNFQFVTNGTLALQLAIRSLDIDEGEIITTPFSYVATTSSILWERATPVFVDINPETLCIDANMIEAAITSKTRAIMGVHVFGNPCDVEVIESIANKHNLKVIYDGSHAFGVEYKGKSLFEYGDISTCSFHATKVFHTIEGGGVFTKDPELDKKIDLLKRFGHNYDDHISIGINAKASEFQAAMGLTNLEYVDAIITKRKSIFDIYNNSLTDKVKKVKFDKDVKQNYSYYPIIFESEEKLLLAIEALSINSIYPRRYFYPSLNKIGYISGTSCPVSEDIASRILCLPIYFELLDQDVEKISNIINESQL